MIVGETIPYGLQVPLEGAMVSATSAKTLFRERPRVRDESIELTHR